jgi:hypothetical protein
MTDKTGGPAYPTNQYANGISPSGHSQGMTLRDYFAAKVLATACEDYSPWEAAKVSYEYADAMLEARK